MSLGSSGSGTQGSLPFAKLPGTWSQPVTWTWSTPYRSGGDPAVAAAVLEVALEAALEVAVRFGKMDPNLRFGPLVDCSLIVWFIVWLLSGIDINLDLVNAVPSLGVWPCDLSQERESHRHCPPKYADALCECSRLKEGQSHSCEKVSVTFLPCIHICLFLFPFRSKLLMRIFKRGGGRSGLYWPKPHRTVYNWLEI